MMRVRRASHESGTAEENGGADCFHFYIFRILKKNNNQAPCKRSLKRQMRVWLASLLLPGRNTCSVCVFTHLTTVYSASADAGPPSFVLSKVVMSYTCARRHAALCADTSEYVVVGVFPSQRVAWYRELITIET